MFIQKKVEDARQYEKKLIESKQLIVNHLH